MSNPGPACPCTPRSLLQPAGGVYTLDARQRVSRRELDTLDAQWKSNADGVTPLQRGGEPFSSVSPEKKGTEGEKRGSKALMEKSSFSMWWSKIRGGRSSWS